MLYLYLVSKKSDDKPKFCLSAYPQGSKICPKGRQIKSLRNMIESDGVIPKFNMRLFLHDKFWNKGKPFVRMGRKATGSCHSRLNFRGGEIASYQADYNNNHAIGDLFSKFA